MRTKTLRIIARPMLIWLLAAAPGDAAEKPDKSAGPRILCHPETQVIREHLKAEFTVTADTPPGPGMNAQFNYQWQRQGPGKTNYVDLQVAGATNDTFRIDKVSTNDVAYYRVRVSSANGTSFSEPAQLLVFTVHSPITVYGSPV